jgi:O-antigen/teichoic acid export membrane protein
VTLRLALTVPATILALAVCLWIADDATMHVAAVLACATLPVAAASALRAVFQLRVRNTVVTAIEVGNGLLWGGAVVVVALAGGGLVAIAAAFLGATAVTNLVTVVIALRTAPVQLRGAREHWPALLRLGLPVGIGGLLTLGYGYVDQVIVFQVAGAREAGLYGSVYRIYERAQFLPSTLMTTLFPIFVVARDTDRARVRRLFGIASDYLVLVSLPALAISLAGPEQIVRLLFGVEFADAAPALPVLMAALVVVSVGHLTGYLIVAYRLQKEFVVLGVAALVLNVGANLALVPAYGFIAAAWVTLGTEIIVMSVSMWLVCRRAETVPWGPHLGRIVLASVITGLIAWGLRVAGVPTLVWLAVAGLAYGGLLLALGAVRGGELRALLRR